MVLLDLSVKSLFSHLQQGKLSSSLQPIETGAKDDCKTLNLVSIFIETIGNHR